jgi:hypothetical protein
LQKISQASPGLVQGAGEKQEAGMDRKKTTLSRRNFLLTVGAGGAATAAAIVAKNAATGNPTGNPAGGKDKRATSGYKVSEHIENYYRTTKV